MNNIDTIIFDLDGVLWHLDFYKLGNLIAADLQVPSDLVGEFSNEIVTTINKLLKTTDVMITNKVVLNIINENIEVTKYGLTDLQIFYALNSSNYDYCTINPNALYVVKELFDRGYRILAKSNWFLIAQEGNLNRFNLTPYFTKVTGIIDDYMKPNPQALDNLIDEEELKTSVIIGDTPAKEMKLANDLGINSIWLNENNLGIPEDKPTFEVHSLKGILEIL